jgi:hypothetical protein
MTKRKVQKDNQLSTKHTYKTKDRITRTPLKTGDEVRCSGNLFRWDVDDVSCVHINRFFIVLADWHKHPWIDMLLHSTTLSGFRANQWFLLFLNVGIPVVTISNGPPDKTSKVVSFYFEFKNFIWTNKFKFSLRGLFLRKTGEKKLKLTKS